MLLKFCIQNEPGYIISLYRLPSQTHDEFTYFFLNFKQVLHDDTTRNPRFVLTTSDLNTRAAKWWRNDMTNTEGTKIDSVTTSYGYSQNPSKLLFVH